MALQTNEIVELTATRDQRHLFIVLNGKKSGDKHLREAVEHLREEGHEVDVRVTWENADAERHVKEALALTTVNTIVAAGGDGTVNEVASALVKLDAPKSLAMGVIPMGTANDFATSTALPEDPWEALQLCTMDTAQPIDVGLVNDKVFMNVATGGFGTEVTVKTDPKMKQQLGGAAYIITGLTSFSSISAKQATLEGPAVSTVKKAVKLYQISTPQPAPPPDEAEGNNADRADGGPSTSSGHRLVPDGEKLHVSGELLILAVGNGRQAGGGMRLCPYAVLDDGLLDVSYIMNYPGEQVPTLLRELMRGREESDTLEIMDCFGSMRVKWLEVHCADGLQINCDGEPMRATHFTFKVLPQRLRLHMPQPKLLRQPSRVLNPAQRQYRSKIQTQLERPARRPKRTLFTHPIVQSLLTNGLVLGMGVALTIAMQQLHQRRLRSDT
ncbi:hypothetical protein ABBQ32_009773 [Trebouxia sp. C0010 RCD-2024]